MNFYRKRPLLITSIALFALSFIVRFQIKDLTNFDAFIIGRWYAHLYNNGWMGLADGHFSNYPPAYLYLLWASTFLDDMTGRLVAIKIIPTLFDMLSTFFIFHIARLKYETGDMPYLYAAAFFSLPTVAFNSTGWGQVDSCFTSFLILCVYLLLKEKPFWAAAAFGMAFSFKAQSIFLLPFLGVMFLKGKIRWQHFLLMPVPYLMLAVPAVATGRSWQSILTIYPGQVTHFQKLSYNAPNLYIFISNELYGTGVVVGMLIFFTCMAAWMRGNWRASGSLERRRIIFMAFTSLALVPFLLPKMHARYFYPADVFSFIAAIFIPELWFLPILYQISSALSCSVFILGASVAFVMVGALINTFSTAYILRKQMEALYEP